MKKEKIWILIFIFMMLASVLIILLSNDEKSVYQNVQNNSLQNQFAKEYALQNKLSYFHDEAKVINTTKEITYLLLGKITESDTEYTNRHQMFLEYALYNHYDREDETLLTKYAKLSGNLVPSMFLAINKLDIQYTSMQNTRVIKEGELIKASILLPKVVMKQAVATEESYRDIQQDLTINYFYVNFENNYYLVYLYAEIGDDQELALGLDETKALKEADDALIIANAQKDAIAVEAFSNGLGNYQQGKGIIIGDDIVITTYDFIMNCIQKTDYLYTKYNNNLYKVAGILTMNPDSDIAVIKLEDHLANTVILDKDIQIGENVYIYRDDQLVKGYLLANDNYLETNISITNEDIGSPIYNAAGKIIGIMTGKSLNKSTSLALNAQYLDEVQSLFVKQTNLKYKTLNELKEEYYYYNYVGELDVNTIKPDIWQKFNDEFNFEDLHLPLKKGSYKDHILSLRYLNDISDYLPSSIILTNFMKSLLDKGYQEKLNTVNKGIYENDNYRLMLLNEFNYIIIIVVEK